MMFGKTLGVMSLLAACATGYAGERPALVAAPAHTVASVQHPRAAHRGVNKHRVGHRHVKRRQHSRQHGLRGLNHNNG